MTIIRIESVPIVDPLGDTTETMGAADHEIVADIDVRGRVHHIRTCEAEEHAIEIRFERGRFKSVTGPGLDGLADDATSLAIASWIRAKADAPEMHAFDKRPLARKMRELADRICNLEWSRVHEDH